MLNWRRNKNLEQAEFPLESKQAVFFLTGQVFDRNLI